MNTALLVRFGSAVLVCGLVAACGGDAESDDMVAATSAPTTVAATEQTTTTMTVSEEQLAAAAAVGDMAAGEELFQLPTAGLPHSLSCASCHTLDGSDRPDGPTLAGISAIAADRVAGMSALDYMRQSIVDPYGFVVPGDWRFPMPYQYPDLFTEEEIDNLIAFLLTR